MSKVRFYVNGDISKVIIKEFRWLKIAIIEYRVVFELELDNKEVRGRRAVTGCTSIFSPTSKVGLKVTQQQFDDLGYSNCTA